MKLSMISSLALAGAMLMSTGVLAQDATAAAPTMIGAQAVSAADLPKVQAQCNTLASVDMQSGASDTSSTSSGDADGAGDSTDPASDVPNGTDQATSAVDLSLITVEECKTAGLVK